MEALQDVDMDSVAVLAEAQRHQLEIKDQCRLMAGGITKQIVQLKAVNKNHSC